VLSCKPDILSFTYVNTCFSYRYMHMYIYLVTKLKRRSQKMKATGFTQSPTGDLDLNKLCLARH